MATFKLVIGQKNGTCVQKEVADAQAEFLLGKKIGDSVNGSDVGLSGYEFSITGGSDFCGFPMRKEIQGVLRKKIFAGKGVGVKPKGKGIRIRKTVAANTIHDRTAQVNLKILKEGSTPLVEVKAEEVKTAVA